MDAEFFRLRSGFSNPKNVVIKGTCVRNPPEKPEAFEFKESEPPIGFFDSRAEEFESPPGYPILMPRTLQYLQWCSMLFNKHQRTEVIVQASGPVGPQCAYRRPSLFPIRGARR
jgi:hypothetical protein